MDCHVGIFQKVAKVLFRLPRRFLLPLALSDIHQHVDRADKRAG